MKIVCVDLEKLIGGGKGFVIFFKKKKVDGKRESLTRRQRKGFP